MFLKKDENQKQTIEELEIQIENLDRETEALLKELQISPDQLTRFIEKEENFSKENWEKLQEEKKKLDHKLLRDLRAIADPRKTKEAYNEKNIDNRWLFVK